MRVYREEITENPAQRYFVYWSLNVGAALRAEDQCDVQLNHNALTPYFVARPEFFKYLKNSELGSTTMRSFLFLKLCLYASKLL